MFHTAFELFWQSGLYMQSARAHVHSLCNSYMGNDFSCSELPFKNLKWNIVVQYLSTIWNYTLKHSSSVIGCWTAVWGTLDRSWTGTSMLKQTAVWILFTSVPFSSLPPFFFIKNSLTEMSVLVVMSRHLDTQWPSVLQFHMPTLQRDEVNWGWDIMGAIVRPHTVLLTYLLYTDWQSVWPPQSFTAFLSEPMLCQLKMPLYSCC